MGDSYEIQWLGDNPYLTVRNKSTKWSAVCIMLTPEQHDKYESFMSDFSDNSDRLLKEIYEEAKVES